MEILKAKSVCLGRSVVTANLVGGHGWYDETRLLVCEDCSLRMNETEKEDHQRGRLTVARIEEIKRDQAKKALFHHLSLKRAREEGYIFEKTYELGNHDIGQYKQYQASANLKNSIPKYYAQRGGIDYNS